MLAEPVNCNCDMYYTGKGDDGTSELFAGKKRLLKSEQIFAVLGSLDELNSFLGLCLVEAKTFVDLFEDIKIEQNNIFICQAHFAGAKISIPPDLVSSLEKRMKKYASVIKPRKGFVAPGGSRLSATLDITRTIARKVEREALSLSLKERLLVSDKIYSYLNRLSSFLYVLARYSNDLTLEKEFPPKY